MKRKIEKSFYQWFKDDLRNPLVIRGARQVGKTWLSEIIGKELTKSVIKIDFEAAPEAKSAFSTLDPTKIIADLELISSQRIDPEKSLLVLDEIQLCPGAIRALRYFKEKMPTLAVVANGSLLEFALNKEKFSFPVGRISFLYMHPMSFKEFLGAIGEERSIEEIERSSCLQPCSQIAHEKLLNLVMTYFKIGGMPAVVDSYVRSKSWLRAREIQSALLQSYRLDFPKYATSVQVEHLENCLQKLPALIGRSIKYVNIDREARSRDIKAALQLLQWAGLVNRIHPIAADGLPLAAHIYDRPGKLLLHDIGIMQAGLGGSIKPARREDLTDIHRGALAEQFVGQELIALSPEYEPAWLSYWERGTAEATPNSQAEVDYLIALDEKIIPIEVKSGKIGTLKSLHLFMKEKKSLLGIRVSTHPLKKEDKILSVPFYLVSEIPRLTSYIHA